VLSFHRASILDKGRGPRHSLSRLLRRGKMRGSPSSVEPHVCGAAAAGRERSIVAHSPTTTDPVEPLYAARRDDFVHWEKTKDLVDQCIDLMLNFRQSGHPGGSRSKVHAMLSTLL
jgi:hypothetical protein